MDQDALTVAVPMFVEVLNQTEVDADTADDVTATLQDGLAPAAIGDLHLVFALRFGSTRDAQDLTGTLLIRGPQRPGETQIHKLLTQAARDLVLGTHARAEEALRSVARAEENVAAAHATLAAAQEQAARDREEFQANVQRIEENVRQHTEELQKRLGDYQQAERDRAAALPAEPTEPEEQPPPAEG